MNKFLLDKIEEFGYAAISQVISDEQIKNLIEKLSNLNVLSADGRKNGTAYGVRNLMNLVPEVRELAESEKVKSLVKGVLGERAKCVKAIYFDKTPEANWKVPWHQDLTVAVKEKREAEGFSAWTQKAEIQHVQPPIRVLEKILAMRIHLDDADETNGALKVVPKSHNRGRLSAAQIQNLRKANRIEVCRIKRGDAFLMRPLLVHSSSAGTSPKHRRVIHIEFSAENLPDGLEWYGS